MTGAALGELIQRGDPAALLVEVDRRCAAGDWDGLVDLRDRCEAAVEFGKQLWSVAQFAEYRLALEGPGPYAARVCRSGAARFALGPLTEVAASTHRWDELADHLGEPWVAATVAHERALRGEDLRDDPRAHPAEVEAPLALADWEPHYPLPTYRAYELHEGGPEPVDAGAAAAGSAAAGSEPREHPRLERALREVVATWTETSNGGADIAVVAADAAAAAGSLEGGDAGLVPVAGSTGLAWLAWAAASGGALGRRRGMAAGRSSALWVLQAAGDVGFPAEPAALGAVCESLRWFLLVGGSPGGPADASWRLRLAVADPDAGWAAAVDAWDGVPEGAPDPRKFAA